MQVGNNIQPLKSFFMNTSTVLTSCAELSLLITRAVNTTESDHKNLQWECHQKQEMQKEFLTPNSGWCQVHYGSL